MKKLFAWFLPDFPAPREYCVDPEYLGRMLCEYQGHHWHNDIEKDYVFVDAAKLVIAQYLRDGGIDFNADMGLLRKISRQTNRQMILAGIFCWISTMANVVVLIFRL